MKNTCEDCRTSETKPDCLLATCGNGISAILIFKNRDDEFAVLCDACRIRILEKILAKLKNQQ